MDGSEKSKETMLIGPTYENGFTDGAIVRENGTVEPVHFRTVEDGRPITGELIEMTPSDVPGVCHIRTLYKSSDGPTKVNSRAYRSNWDQIFNKSVN
jgi:hypothetical protein